MSAIRTKLKTLNPMVEAPSKRKLDGEASLGPRKRSIRSVEKRANNYEENLNTKMGSPQTTGNALLSEVFHWGDAPSPNTYL